MNRRKSSIFALSLISSSSLILSACSSSDSSNDNASENTTQVSGSVFASYVSGASVSATDTAGNTIAGPVLSDDMGNFSLPIPDQYLDVDFIVKANGGEYTDEASGESTLHSQMTAFIEANSLSDSNTFQFSITPSSSIVERLISLHNLSAEDAVSRFSEAFGYTPDIGIIPVDATQSNDSEETASILAGLRAATFSQLTADLSLPASAQGALLQLLADDLADGNFDGMEDGMNDLELVLESSEAIALGYDIQNKFNLAFDNFRNSGMDMTGLNDASVGQLPFAKTAMSESYTVTYVPGMMDAMQGKTSFSLQVTDQQGEAVSGLTPTISPLMYMADRVHSTPYTSVSEDSEEPGRYHANVYYLMPSNMANGMAMGAWQLGVDLGEESVTFFPNIMMAMGDTVRANLKGQADSIMGMMDTEEKRSYMLFNNGLVENDGMYDFSVFIATKESMMSFPAISDGLTLNSGTNYELSINEIIVEMTTDISDEDNWMTASNTETGVWTVSGIDGLGMQDQDTIYVRLTVNGEQKTDDGNTPDGIGDNAEFTLTVSSDSMMM